MEQLTETFRRLVEESQTPPAQWVLWLIRQSAEQLADPITRVELEHALRESPELLAELQAALDGIGAVVADAGLAAQAKPDVWAAIRETREAMARTMESTMGEVGGVVAEALQRKIGSEEET